MFTKKVTLSFDGQFHGIAQFSDEQAVSERGPDFGPVAAYMGLSGTFNDRLSDALTHSDVKSITFTWRDGRVQCEIAYIAGKSLMIAYGENCISDAEAFVSAIQPFTASI